MPRKPLENRFTRSLIELGEGTLCITLPKEYLSHLGWEKGEEVKVHLRKVRKQLVLKKSRE